MTCKECYKMEKKALLTSTYAHEIRISSQNITAQCNNPTEKTKKQKPKTKNLPVRRNLNECPALFPKLFSTGAPAPACACWSRGAADDNSPVVPSGLLSAVSTGKKFLSLGREALIML